MTFMECLSFRFPQIGVVKSREILYNTNQILSRRQTPNTGASAPFTEETMEQKAKRVGNFNIIDIIAVILIVAVVAFGAWKLLGSSGGRHASGGLHRRRGRRHGEGDLCG
jgi:hypothetical protein